MTALFSSNNEPTVVLISSKDEIAILVVKLEVIFIKTNKDLLSIKIKTIYFKGMKI